MSSLTASTTTLKPMDASGAVPASAYFGYSCAMSGIYLVIGANQESSSKGAIYLYTWSGSAWTSPPIRTPNPTTVAAYFGSSCSITVTNSICYVLVGAPNETTPSSGAAYLYYLNGNTLTLIKKIVQSDSGITSTFLTGTQINFGCSCAINGNYLVIGFSTEGVGATYNYGSAYIFYFTGTSTCYFIKKLTMTDYNGTAYSSLQYYFGNSCAILGNNIAIGAYQDPTVNSTGAGIVYTYTLISGTWTFNKRLLPGDSGITPTTSMYFGSSCAMSGNFLVIGAYAEPSNSKTGAAYVYIWNGSTWNFNKRLLQADSGTTVASTYFGQSCAISGNYLVIGAYNETINSQASTGAVYVYYWNGSTWNYMSKQATTDLTIYNGAYFGQSCAISGNYMAIGGNNATYSGNSSCGIVYTYFNNNASTVTPVIINGFANACGISNNNIVVGNTNKTHIFTNDGSNWNTLSTLN